MALLEVRDVRVRFGGVMAVGGVDLDVDPGQVTGLIGPNGAGKTTLFNVITGVQPPSSGRVALGGEDVSNAPAHRRARLGMARTFQRIELFSTLSVRDNIVVAAEASKGRGARSVDDLVARLGLGEVADTRAGELPTGTARLVEVARALATGPRILLLDEPASGLDDQESQDFGHLLRELAADGLAVVLVEHDVGLVMRVCDDVYVLDLGLIIAHGAPHAVQNDEAVLRAYLGAA